MDNEAEMSCTEDPNKKLKVNEHTHTHTHIYIPFFHKKHITPFHPLYKFGTKESTTVLKSFSLLDQRISEHEAVTLNNLLLDAVNNTN